MNIFSLDPSSGFFSAGMTELASLTTELGRLGVALPVVLIAGGLSGRGLLLVLSYRGGAEKTGGRNRRGGRRRGNGVIEW